MKRNRLHLFGRITVICASLLLCGCGKKEEKSLAETIGKATEKVNEKASDENTGDNSVGDEDDSKVYEGQITAKDSSDGVDFSIDDTLVGTYVYNPGNDQEDCNFEIFRVGDGYYIEYSGEYDYAGAELHINSRKDEMNCFNYNTTLYAFSGFSFMGDYWGKGHDVQIKAFQNGYIVLSEGQPFLDRQELQLKRTDHVVIHVSQAELTENSSKPEVIGTWRCLSKRDGDEHEITMVLSKDGRFRAVDKVKEQTPAIYIGKYIVSGDENDSVGLVDIERFAYGGMPDSWILMYDEEGKHPYVYSDYMYAEPFTFLEGDDMNLPFEKVSDSEKSNITMGPGSRASEVQEIFDEYSSGTDEHGDDENEYAEHEEIPENEYIEDVIYYAQAYTKAPICVLDSVTNGPDGDVVAIHCYEIVGEGENAHTATWDWIYYHKNTGKYYDFFDNEIDMSKYR